MPADPKTEPTIDAQALQDRFELAVETAASRAAQRVARIHRIRLVRWTVAATLGVCLIVTVAVWFFAIKPQEQSFSRANSLYNCRVLRSAANTMADFVQTDINLRKTEEKLTNQQQVLSGYTKLFGKGELGKLIKQSHKVDYVAINHWQKIDIPLLKNVVGIDCATQIAGHS